MVDAARGVRRGVFFCFCFIYIFLFQVCFPVFSAEKETISFAYAHRGAPYCWTLNSGWVTGIFIDLIDEIFVSRLGVSVSHFGCPWIRAQRMVEKGKVDAFCTIANSKREKYAIFCPNTLLSSNVRIATSKVNSAKDDILQINRLSGLKDYKLVTYRGNGFAETNTDFDITLVNDSYTAMLALAANHYDIFFDLGEHVAFSARKVGVEDEIVSAPFAAYPIMHFRLGISRKSPWAKRVKEINRVIQEIHEDGTYDIILERYDMSRWDSMH